MAVLLSLAIAGSCSKEQPAGDEGQPHEDPVVFGIDTRNAELAPNTTFRVLLYETSRDHLYRFHTTGKANTGTGRGWGTYYYNKETFNQFPVLTPCELDNDGQFVQAGSVDDYGINGQSQPHYVAYISPGLAHNESDGTVDVDPTKTFYATGAQRKSLGGYGVVLIDSALVDRRAKIGLRILKGDNISSFSMSDVAIRGAGGDGTDGNPSAVTYHPCTQQVLENTTQRNIPLSEVSTGAEYDTGLRYRSTSDENYIVASIYARRDAVSALIRAWYQDIYYTGNFIESDYLYLKCRLQVNGGEWTDVLMPLTTKLPVLRPMHTYIFNITVRSEYIALSVEIHNYENNNSWDEVTPDGGATVDNPTAILPLGTFRYGGDDNGWEDIDDDGQTIG